MSRTLDTTVPVVVRGPFADLAPAAPIEILPPFSLRTARMILRPLREGDRPEFLRVVRRGEEELKANVVLHKDGENDEAFFSRQLSATRAGDDRGTAWRRIGVLADGRIAGMFNLNAVSRGLDFKADAAWWIDPDLKGIGLGTEGVRGMIDYALGERGLGLHRVEAAIKPDNVASRRLAERVGFKRESGGANVRLGERWEPHELYSITVEGGAGVLARQERCDHSLARV